MIRQFMTDKKHVTSTTSQGLNISLGSFCHVWGVNLGLSCQESTKNTGLPLNLVEERLAGITLAHRWDGPITSGWEADGDKDRDGIAKHFFFFFFNNKVTKEERSAERQSARRYKQDRRSDSLKRYRSVFDFPRPDSQALQNNLAAVS